MIAVDHVFGPEPLVRDFRQRFGLLGGFHGNFCELARPRRQDNNIRAAARCYRHHRVHLSKGTLTQEITDRVRR